MDLTGAYWEAVMGAARANGLPEDGLTKLRQRQILRSLAAKTAFTKAAVEVAHNVTALRRFLREQQRDYAQLGKLGEGERDRIEEEVGVALRSCSANIGKLQEMLAAGGGGSGPAGSPARPQQQPPSPDLLAHRQGQVLILIERLRAATALFDCLRSLRYQQLQQQEANRLRRLPQRSPGDGGGDGAAPQRQQTTGQLHARLQQRQQQQGPAGAAAAAAWREQQQQQQQQGWMGAAAPDRGGGIDAAGQQQQQQQQQQQADAENQALQLELLGMNDQVQHAERTVREIATLNQMFSAAIAQQGEQIEQLYSEAVQATCHISAANVQLGKAVRTNRGARKYMIVFFLVASLGLLFLDWWNS